MSLVVKYQDDIDVELITAFFDEQDKSFKLSGNVLNNKEEIEIELKYILNVYKDYEYSDYELYVLHNNSLGENDIYQVYDKEKSIRMGWIFPIQALESKEHDYSENQHFLKYAYVAMELLLRDKTNIHAKEPKYEQYNRYYLKDFYDNESMILILSKEQLKKIEDFNIDDYIPDFYNYGYVFKGESSGTKDKSLDKRINLSRISKFLREEEFIFQLFKEFIGTEKSALLKFYLLYQVIELLMEKIFNNEFTNIMDKLSKSSNSLFDLKEDLGEVANEKVRIKKLFNNYCSSIQYSSELMQTCNKLLEKSNKKTWTSVAESLYSVRNLLVHQYRGIPKEELMLIDDINYYFESVIVDIVIIYNEDKIIG